MVTGSYRIDDCIEVYDLRMYKRSRVIPWEGTGSQELLMYDDDGQEDDQPVTDNEEAKSDAGSVFGTRPASSLKRDSDSQS